MARNTDKRQKFSVSPEAHRRLRIEAAKSGMTIGEVLDWLILETLPGARPRRDTMGDDAPVTRRRRAQE